MNHVIVLIIYFTNSMEQSPSWEANSKLAASQEIPIIYQQNTKTAL
jgi:hypothetical protein